MSSLRAVTSACCLVPSALCAQVASFRSHANEAVSLRSKDATTRLEPRGLPLRTTFASTDVSRASPQRHPGGGEIPPINEESAFWARGYRAALDARETRAMRRRYDREFGHEAIPLKFNGAPAGSLRSRNRLLAATNPPGRACS